MIKRFIAAAGIVVCALSFTAVAQNIEGVNARLDGMGGIGTPADIGWTIGKPSYLYRWADRVQASAIIKDIEGIGKAYGSIIAIKSFGEHTFLGISFNNRKALSGSFYKIAIEQAKFNENFGSTGTGRFFPDIPHVNLGFKFGDNFTGGVGTYMEASKHDSKHENQFFYRHSGGTNTLAYDSSVYSKYFGLGLIADARIWAGPIKINPEFRMFIPSLERTEKSDLVSKLKATNHDVSDDGMLVSGEDKSAHTSFGENLFLRIGSKVSGTVQEKLFWIVGYWYKNEKFRFSRDMVIDSATLSSSGAEQYSTKTSKYNTFAFNTTYNDLWIGLQPLFGDDMLMSVEYSGTMQTYAPSHEDYLQDSTRIYMTHKLRFGAEATVQGFWCFEEFKPRFGLKYTLFGELMRYKQNEFINDNGDTTNFNEDIRFPWSTNFKPGDPENGKGLKVSTGFGLNGRRGVFDISCDILTWTNGTITGPSAAMASWTLDFGRKD